MLRSLLLALLSLGILTATVAQTPATRPDTTTARLKGKIWTATARQVWADCKLPSTTKPEPWPTDKDFQQWIDTHGSDQSGLRELRQAARNYRTIKLKGTAKLPGGDLTPAQLRDALLAAVHDLGSRKQDKLYRVSAKRLRKELNELVSPVMQGKGTATTATSSIIPPAAESVRVTESVSTTQPIASRPAEEQPAPVRKAAVGYSWRWLLLMGIAGVLLGMLAAITIRKILQNQAEPPLPPSPKARVTASTTANMEQNAANSMRESYRKLERENTKLQQRVAELQQENEQLRQALSLSASPTAAVVTTGSTSETSAPLTALTHFYASAVPGGLLDHDKLIAQPMSRMALQLALSASQATQASFTLNPNVDKNWLIEADLEKLREYFTFTLPTDRWPSSVAAVGPPGFLTRQGNNWQVTQKACLDVR